MLHVLCVVSEVSDGKLASSFPRRCAVVESTSLSCDSHWPQTIQQLCHICFLFFGLVPPLSPSWP